MKFNWHAGLRAVLWTSGVVSCGLSIGGVIVLIVTYATPAEMVIALVIAVLAIVFVIGGLEQRSPGDE